LKKIVESVYKIFLYSQIKYLSENAFQNIALSNKIISTQFKFDDEPPVYFGSKEITLKCSEDGPGLYNVLYKNLKDNNDLNPSFKYNIVNSLDNCRTNYSVEIKDRFNNSKSFFILVKHTDTFFQDYRNLLSNYYTSRLDYQLQIFLNQSNLISSCFYANVILELSFLYKYINSIDIKLWWNQQYPNLFFYISDLERSIQTGFWSYGFYPYSSYCNYNSFLNSTNLLDRYDFLCGENVTQIFLMKDSCGISFSYNQTIKLDKPIRIPYNDDTVKWNFNLTIGHQPLLIELTLNIWNNYTNKQIVQVKNVIGPNYFYYKKYFSTFLLNLQPGYLYSWKTKSFLKNNRSIEDKLWYFKTSLPNLITENINQLVTNHSIFFQWQDFDKYFYDIEKINYLCLLIYKKVSTPLDCLNNTVQINGLIEEGVYSVNITYWTANQLLNATKKINFLNDKTPPTIWFSSIPSQTGSNLLNFTLLCYDNAIEFANELDIKEPIIDLCSFYFSLSSLTNATSDFKLLKNKIYESNQYINSKKSYMYKFEY